MKNIFIVLLIFFALNAYASKRSDIVQSLFKVVENWMGTPYELGSRDKEGIDCSGFTSMVYSEVFQMDLPRSVSGQKQLGELVKDKLQPGDLIFFNIDGRISHVGVYVFDNKFIHAASAGPEVGVIKSSLDENYYKTRYAFAKRVVALPGFEKNETTISETASDEELKLEVSFGKTLYRNKIIDESSLFKTDKPVFLKIKSDKRSCDFVIQFENRDTSKIERSIELQLIENDINKKIELTRGAYLVKLFMNNRQILQKEIIVE